MQQVDGASLSGRAGHGIAPAARPTAVAIMRAFAAPMIDSRYRFSPSATARSRIAISDVDAAVPASAKARAARQSIQVSPLPDARRPG